MQILEHTLFTFIANVALESIELCIEFLELSDGVGALSFVDDEDDEDDSQQSTSADCHSNDPVLAVTHHNLLVLQVTKWKNQITHNYLETDTYLRSSPPKRQTKFMIVFSLKS